MFSSSKDYIIVFNVMDMYHYLCKDLPAALCGHRYGQVIKQLNELLEWFCMLRAELVFFMDGRQAGIFPERFSAAEPQLEIDIWRCQIKAYEQTCALTDAINRGESLADIARSPIGTLRHLPEQFFLGSLCRQYGELFVSVDHECNLEMAKYATKHKAKAVLAEVCFCSRS